MYIRIFASEAGKGLFGQSTDCRILNMVLRQLRLKQKGGSKGPQWNIEFCDPLTWGTGNLTLADIHIYNETPVRMAVPWASYNVAVVNAEWWEDKHWGWTLDELDLFVLKAGGEVEALFMDIPAAKRLVIPWKCDMMEDFGSWAKKESVFLYLVGGSLSKLRAARDVIAGWQAGWPTLEIWCPAASAEKMKSLVAEGAEVNFQTEYKSAEEKVARQRACKWHVVASAAEGFGLTMAEAAACGVPVVWSELPVQRWTWNLGDRGRIAVSEIKMEGTLSLRQKRVGFTKEALATAVTSVLSMGEADVRDLQAHYKKRREWAVNGFLAGWGLVFERFKRDRHVGGRLPTQIPKGTMPPKVGVITLTRNRKGWWTNMVQNLLKQKWPMSRLEWIIVDDSDPDKRVSDEVEEFERRAPGWMVRYVELEGEGWTIGEKRNRAVTAAGADVTHFICMDDDDHYPPDSIVTRMSWLSRPGAEIAYCSTIPMYDIRRYISAMNVPPLNEAPAQRVSEATLAFTRTAWAARPFPEVSMAEGEGFVKGREAVTVEMPPAGVIVSFIHAENTSSRRVPADQEPNGCHYGFSDEYFRYLHGIYADAK